MDLSLSSLMLRGWKIDYNANVIAAVAVLEVQEH